MKVKKSWNVELTEIDWETLDFWFAVCKDNKTTNCCTCMFSIGCNQIASDLDLELEEDFIG